VNNDYKVPFRFNGTIDKLDGSINLAESPFF
jgi:hypothetical protein